jgi:4-carboxymuconolactone decarboxylase
VLFGEVWSREDGLSIRDRSVVTVVALMGQGLTDSSFQFHLMSAKGNGVTRTEIAEKWLEPVDDEQYVKATDKEA